MIDQPPLGAYEARLAAAADADAAFAALADLAQATVGWTLFAVSLAGTGGGSLCRAYCSDPAALPARGPVPTSRQNGSALLAGGKTVAAAGRAAVAAAYTDPAAIEALGCSSAIHLPVMRDGALAAVIELLAADRHYTPGRVAFCERHLTGPAADAIARAAALG